MIPLGYTIRNILKHKVTTTMTILGVSLVVFVFAAAQMLSYGLKSTLVSTGSDDNAIVIRKSSQSEVQSIILRDQGQIVGTSPEIARAADGSALYTNEIYVLINQPKRATGELANIVVRGVTPKSLELRPAVKLIAGRMWQDAGSEVIAGKSAAERYAGCGLGEKLRFGAREWTVVGVFDAQGSGFDSELWGDVVQIADVFRRPIYSSVTFRMADTTQFEAMKARLENDRRMEVDVFREKEYYAAQSRTLAGFIGIGGTIVSIIFSLGAIVGAMITMYASVANRVREIGTLRSLGFSRLAILISFLIEAMAISLTGGLLGIVGASFLGMLQVATTNWDTFSQIAFNFRLSTAIVIAAVVFALVMGLVGGFLPAVRAARLKIVDSLRAA
ncbi:MAG: ABC transporter permease [candidate division Zixibacteria bacterium]|nr:ABC transporter permease [candidate division Zixibacteria bacterium]